MAFQTLMSDENCNKKTLYLLQKGHMRLATEIGQRISALPPGRLLLASDFVDLGSSEAIRLTLFRLEKQGAIKRVAQGMYVRPVIHPLLGPLLPTAEEVADAIIRRDKIRTLPTGAFALNALGLSTQVPVNIVLLTDGSPRVIQVGKRKIKFKKTTPKNLMARGKISRLVIQALKEIGNGFLRDEEEQRIMALLKNEAREDLIHDIPLAPVWIQKIMRKVLIHE
jgi:ribosomal protein S19E (S16A)